MTFPVPGGSCQPESPGRAFSIWIGFAMLAEARAWPLAGAARSAASAAAGPARMIAAAARPRRAREVRPGAIPGLTGFSRIKLRARSAPRSAHRGEAFSHLWPVHDVPPGVDVVGPAVLVLEVVGVLPDVDAKQRGLTVADRIVLVRGGDHGERRAVVHEPGPARAELVHARILELRLELIVGPEGGLDRGAELAVGLASAVRGHPLPEQRVVVVPAAVVAHCSALVVGQRSEVLEHLANVPLRPLGPLQRSVDLVDVCLVMLVVMDAHRLLIDVRLERVVVVREGRN